MFSYRLFTKQGFKNPCVSGKDIGDAKKLGELWSFQDITEKHSLENCKFVSSVRVKGTLCTENYIIRIAEGFGQIAGIATNENNVYFLYYKVKTNYFDPHLAAYCIETSRDPDIINNNRLVNYHPTLINRLSDELQSVFHRILYND